MKELFNKAKTLGIKIADNRHLSMGFHIVSENTEYCFLSYQPAKGFLINMGSWWFFEKKEADLFVKKFNALTELMDELNAKLKTETK